ncbi:hypothetical protein Mbo2_059 [Rhodococcus phage Mbo2]|uniref:Uncharacterized protein n=1 Tax=Rhodococcus phage Mbo2 TaxID=2936911 RepID=A0A9E7IEH1_9CAUD|nr:hypothetical protein Mbo2_059 [Rhodococcus phage Mbo2]
MKLHVIKLQEAARDGIERAKQAQVEWDKNVDAAEAEHERQWKESTLPKWKPLRDKITKALRTGEPIVREDIPVRFAKYSDDVDSGIYRPFNRGRKRHNFGQNDWFADHEFGPRPVLKIAAFETLIDFLGSVAEDTVTTTQLERAGFRNMSKLFEAAANGYWD